MKKTFKIWSALILFLFLFPFIIQFIPVNGSSNTPKLLKDPEMIVYASNVFEGEKPEVAGNKVLLYFTHNHEAYKPVTMDKNGQVAVSHQSENITKFGEKLKTQLDFNGIQTDVLAVNNMAELNKKKWKFERAYKSIRPFVEKRIKEVDYDLIIDLHRDSAGPDQTTVIYNDEKYAKVAFVIGLDHPNYKHNQKKSEQMKAEMERLVPGITRKLISKSGAGVDGKYNQDLHPSVILIELGGIGNSEDELNRTIATIAKAASNILSAESTVEN